MKLLVDENLAPVLALELSDLFSDSTHVSNVGLSSTPDASIWEFAKANGYTFLTKDKDFANLSFALGAPPKVILLQLGNCATSTIRQVIRNNATRIADFHDDHRRGLLVLRAS